jgi:uncharacterized protein YrrD
MKKYLDIRGRNVINDSRSIKGVIDDCILDHNQNKITEVIILYKHFMSTKYFLSLKNIIEFEDYITYSGDMVKINRSTLHKSFTLQGLIGKEICDERKKKIGNLTDVIFDERTGQIKALICTRGFFDDVFEGRKIVMVDDKTIFNKDKVITRKSSIEMVNEIFFRRFLEG